MRNGKRNHIVNHSAESCLQELEAAMRPDTSLVSIMTVNNEIGVKQPMKQIGKPFWNPSTMVIGGGSVWLDVPQESCVDQEKCSFTLMLLRSLFFLLP